MTAEKVSPDNAEKVAQKVLCSSTTIWSVLLTAFVGLLVCAAAVVTTHMLTKQACEANDGFQITYTVESKSLHENFTGAHFTNVFDGTLPPRDHGPLLIDVMDEIAEKNAAFRYKSKTFEGLGESIQEINGQGRVEHLNLYWLVYRLEPNTRCSLPLGASSYRVTNGESILWTLAQWNSTIPVCDGGQHDK